MDTKDPQPTAAPAPDAARKEEATSSDTLGDLEQTEQVSTASTGATNDSSDNSAVPAPDGTPDPERGDNSDGRDTGGPM